MKVTKQSIKNIEPDTWVVWKGKKDLHMYPALKNLDREIAILNRFEIERGKYFESKLSP